MKCVVFSIDKELKKAAKGKKTKIPVGSLLWLATYDYPAVRACIEKVFSIKEIR